MGLCTIGTYLGHLNFPFSPVGRLQLLPSFFSPYVEKIRLNQRVEKSLSLTLPRVVFFKKLYS